MGDNINSSRRSKGSEGRIAIGREKWKDVVGSEGRYKISDRGRVKSFALYKSGRVLSTKLRKDGYVSIGLIYLHGKRRTRSVHKIVADAFLGKCPEGKEVNHIDGIKSNNTLGNLEYVTKSENSIHSYEIGLQSSRGTENGNAKLTDKDVLNVRKMLGKETQMEISRIFNVSKSCIGGISTGRHWGWLK